jgi:hypothetical protein
MCSILISVATLGTIIMSDVLDVPRLLEVIFAVPAALILAPSAVAVTTVPASIDLFAVNITAAPAISVVQLGYSPACI